MEIIFLEDKSARIQTWKVKEGFYLPVGHVIFSYVELDDPEGLPLAGIKRLKTNQSGVIKQIHVKNGQTISKGSILCTVVPCSHHTVMRDMCAECGKDLRKLDEPLPSAAVSMIHSVPDLRISMEQAQKIGKVDEERLLRQKKLVLLVDLDQTLIHTTNDNVPHNLKDVFHFQLWGHGSVWYHTRLRPRTREFLDTIGKLYELHICTFGTRSYAHVIARHLDPHGQFFSDRILSRDECFSQNSKTANLKELFPRGDHMVCIIDDREDVWNFAPNLIHVKPYHFFRHTGDINAPPGLTKQDDDDKFGFTFNNDGTAENKIPEVVASASLDALASVDDVVADEKENDNSGVAQDGDINTTSNTVKVRRVTSDLSLSDEEISNQSKSSGEDAVEGDKEESCDEKKEIASKRPEVAETSETNPEAKEQTVPESKSAEEEPEKMETNESCTQNSLDEKSLEKEEVKTDEEVIITSEIKPRLEITDEIEVEDQDDYLLYLEDILQSIHQAFYSLYSDKRGDINVVPDVKNVVPYVRLKVLKNVSIVFSGVIPTEVPLAERKHTKAYAVARSLGAHISERIIPPNKPCASSETPTTHIVAARVGTAKVNEARRYKGIHIVTPDWLWCCAERWKLVDERLFQLYKKSVVHRYPPGHHSASPNKRRDSPHSESTKNGQMQQKPAARKERTPSGRFCDTINPLLSFSIDEIDSMGHEVDDILNESESSSSSEEDENVFKEMTLRRRSSRSRSEELIAADMDVSELTKGTDSSSDSSDSESETETDDLKVCKKRKRAKTETETEDEPLNVKFRRGEAVPSEVENLMLTSEDENTNENDQDEELWMAQNIEREFMGDDNSQDTG